MSQRGPARPISAAQILGVLAFTLALFFMVAFATKSVEAHRLLAWRDRAETEVADMERERQEIEEEMRRRRAPSWSDQVLREAGIVPDGIVSVVGVTYTPNPNATHTPPPASPTPTPPPVEQASPGNPNWSSWKRLIWGPNRTE